MFIVSCTIVSPISYRNTFPAVDTVPANNSGYTFSYPFACPYPITIRNGLPYFLIPLYQQPYQAYTNPPQINSTIKPVEIPRSGATPVNEKEKPSLAKNSTQPQNPVEDHSSQSVATSHNTNAKESYLQNMRCSCSKTRCLKLYCDCLKAGKECGPLCSCKDCLNRVGYREREAALNFLNKRNTSIIHKHVDKEGVKDTVEICCTCQRSQCVKNYCSCYVHGKKCSSYCACVNCANR